MTRAGAAAATAAALLAIGCGGSTPQADSAGLGVPRPAPDTIAIGPDSLPVLVETIASGLEVPWDLTFVPDGRIFLTERTGRVRVIDNDSLLPESWAQMDVYAEDPAIRPESGLMGIALAPDFGRSGHVYVMATVPRHAGGQLSTFINRVVRRARSLVSGPLESPWLNRIYRFTESNGRGVDRVTIADDLPGSFYHVGGALRFGPDGLLYATIGDVFESPRAQDPTTQVGAILRFRPDGTLPADNPAPRSPVYAHGLRNAQALDWHPRTQELFAIDHGPSFLPHESGRWGQDELNVIRAGANYGWPVASGRGDSGRFAQPVHVWNPGIAPGGFAFYDGTLFPWSGHALIGGLRSQQLRRVQLERSTEGEWTVIEDVVLVQRHFGRIRSVRVGPDGALYITTSNRDGRGQPGPTDDRLLRLTPLRGSARSAAGAGRGN